MTPKEPAGGLLPTRRGPARIQVDLPSGAPRSLLILGHGAGGDVDAPDLVAVTTACVAAGVAVARVTQPYRVAGRRAPAPANHLDEAWVDVVSAVAREGVPLVVGGRSSGARVACRTAVALGASGVLALAFPTHPPGKPERSRVDEIPLGLPVLILNGDRDPFGVPRVGGEATVTVLPGADHGLKKAAEAAATAAVAWLGVRGWAEA
ncbi:alpha/beta family hydrolase [Cryptosporangium sp. NPDC051539]|uniref:alpha/beta hydrolase family protein n=1 Tax=Cryptosporangium sp. NPDC051539 TaxID=3363962 RepID=UPI00378C55E8